MNKATRIGVKLAVVLAAGTVACVASGQNALGDGRRLDANQQIGSGGFNTAVRADFSAANALRAAIVTGNAPGGLSFRGSVGYAAPREFRGELGSDDLFEFRRDSLYSGLSGQGIRGTDALQYQFALTTGNRPPPSLAGSLTVSRDSGGLRAPVDPAMPTRDTTGGLVGTTSAVMRVDPATLDDQRGAGLWRLRSSAGYLTDRSIAESMIGGFENQDGQAIGITASPLGGVRTFEVSPRSQELRDPAAVPSEFSTPAGQPDTLDTSVQVSGLSPFDRVVEGVSDEYARNTGIDTGDTDGPSLAVQLVEEQNAKLREFLASVREQAAPLPMDDEPIDNADEDTGEAGEGERVAARDRLIQQLDALGVERGAIEALRSSEIRVDDLIDPSRALGQDFYATHVAEGRELLRAGRFFDAEARFSMALSVREGDPIASIGRVHAQIGAGLFLSASLNLRETFTEHPMLIAAHYAPDLLPTQERIRGVVDRLNARIDRDGGEARAAALLLAYVGRHTDDEALVRRGLSRLDQDGEDSLAQLLRLVWLNDADVQRSLDALGGLGNGSGGE